MKAIPLRSKPANVLFSAAFCFPLGGGKLDTGGANGEKGENEGDEADSKSPAEAANQAWTEMRGAQNFTLNDKVHRHVLDVLAR